MPTAAPYGKLCDPGALDAQAKVFSALRHLGFTEREVRRVLDELRQRGDSAALSKECLLREALERLGAQRPAR